MKKKKFTLTGKIKDELFGLKNLDECCVLAEILGFLMAEGLLEISSDRQLRIVFNCHSPSVIKRLYLHLHTLGVPVSHSQTEDRRLGFSKNFRICLLGREGVEKLFASLAAAGFIFLGGAEPVRGGPLDIMALRNFTITRLCCAGSFARAIFMSRGSLSQSHGYNLELTLADANLLERTLAILETAGIPMAARSRGGRNIAQARSTSAVQDFFALTGAHKAVMEIANLRVIKEVKNSINRSVNCDSANLGKTAAISTRQVAAIRKLEETGGLDLLPEQFRTTAALRLRNPYESYENLGKLHDPPLKKSVIQYRLGRICQIAAGESSKRSSE